MMIIFELSGNLKTVAAAYWVNGDKLDGKILKSDGEVSDFSRDIDDDLPSTIHGIVGAMGAIRTVDLPGPKDAMAYLGKPADVLKGLRRASLGDER